MDINKNCISTNNSINEVLKSDEQLNSKVDTIDYQEYIQNSIINENNEVLNILSSN